jgi:hypothetical protein
MATCGSLRCFEGKAGGSITSVLNVSGVKRGFHLDQIKSQRVREEEQSSETDHLQFLLYLGTKIDI